MPGGRDRHEERIATIASCATRLRRHCWQWCEHTGTAGEASEGRVIGAASAKHGDAPTANLEEQGIEYHVFLSPRLLLSAIKPN